MLLPENHIRFIQVPDAIKISEPILRDTGYIKFCCHVVFYDDGKCAEVGTKKEWMENVYDKYMNKESSTPRLKTGYNYWKQNRHQQITAMAEDARNNFDLTSRIEFIYRDEANKCFQVFAFYTDRKNEDRAYNFYGLHTAKLIKFIAYFNKAAAHLITEANKPENLIAIPGYTPPPLPEPHRKFVEEMKTVGASVNLGDREIEIMILFAAGCSYEQIAEMFCRSPKTVENHIANIKKKTGCKDRKDFNIYVRDLGLSGMERFFFSYYSHS